MIQISFEINGKRINPNNIKDALKSSILSSVQESIKKSVGSVCCQIHDRSPKIKVKGKNLSNLNFEISGCCEELIENVKREIKK